MDEKCDDVRKECLKSNLDTLNQRIERLNELANFSQDIKSNIRDPRGDDMKKEPPKDEKEIFSGTIPELFTNGLNQIDEQMDRLSSNLESISQLIG